MAQQKVRIKVPKDLTKEDRIELAEDIIDFIQKRTKAGIGFRKKTGRNYNLARVPYTRKYAKRKGTSRTSVDLTLSTEMLESIELLNHASGSITIGYEKGSDVNDKAEGNQIGSYGRSPNKNKARPFLGLSKADLAVLLDEFDA